MMLLADVGEVDEEIADFWTEAQTLSLEDRGERFQVDAKPRTRRRRRRRRPSKSGNRA